MARSTIKQLTCCSFCGVIALRDKPDEWNNKEERCTIVRMTPGNEFPGDSDVCGGTLKPYIGLGS